MHVLDRSGLRRAYFRNHLVRSGVNRIRYSGISDADLFIASYPRSGTTWLRFLLFELLTGETSEFVAVNRAIPYVGKHRDAPRLLRGGGRIIQTHEAYLRGIRSAIYVVRDPRSVVVSEYRWQLRTGLFAGSFDEFFDAFLEGKANPYARWDRHVAMWLTSRVASSGRLHVVRFADLRADAAGALRRVADFMGIDVETAEIERIVAHNALAEMRAKEERAPDWALGTSARPDIRFVGTGSTREWQHRLTQGQIATIEERFHDSLRALGYDSREPPSGDASPRMDARDPAPPRADTAPLKVVYIAGWGRSGSTLLDNLLGQIDGFFSTGELRYLWERGLLRDWRCGCGALVKECKVWSSIVAELAEKPTTPAPETIVRWQQEVTRFRHTGKLLRASPSGVDGDPVLRSYVGLIGDLLSALARTTGARVIVDSSKRPSDAAVLALVPGIELYVVHLVRDPRAVAYAWRKRQEGIDQHRVAVSTISWAAWNLACDAVRRAIPDRSMLVTYESFVEQPRETIQRILTLISEDPEIAPAISGNEFQLEETHTVSGNPGRFTYGPVQIRLDDQWRERLRPTQRAAATAIAVPFLGRYGYRAVASHRRSVASAKQDGGSGRTRG